MTQAPEEPATQALHDAYGINNEIEIVKVAMTVSAELQRPEETTVALIGACAMTDEKVAILDESQRIASLGNNVDGLRTLHRIPPWKPRTNPSDWHGLETGLVDIPPEGKATAIPGTESAGASTAYEILAGVATANANVALELASKEHIDRYGPMATFGWIGSRGIVNTGHILNLARRDPMLPLGIKNGIDGSIQDALLTAKSINSMRKEEQLERSAPAIVIYRGGTNTATPSEWREVYLSALEATEGHLIVDVAHGSEIAHDPKGQKSVQGQIAAMEAVIDLAETGYAPAGIMVEASDLDSPTDPVMPLQLALDGVKRLHAVKQRSHHGLAVV